MLYPKDLLRHPGVYCHNTPDGIPHVHEHFTAAPHPGHRVIAVCGKGGVGKSAYDVRARSSPRYWQASRD